MYLAFYQLFVVGGFAFAIRLILLNLLDPWLFTKHLTCEIDGKFDADAHQIRVFYTKHLLRVLGISGSVNGHENDKLVFNNDLADQV